MTGKAYQQNYGEQGCAQNRWSKLLLFPVNYEDEIWNVGCFFVQLRLQPKLHLFLQAVPAFKINCHVNKTGKSL